MIQLGIISLEHPHATGNHLPSLKYMQECIKVIGIYHPNQEEAVPWLQELKSSYYESIHNLLSEDRMDAVLITSKNVDHAADAITAAKAKKDIFCDKPIALTVNEALQIVSAVKANNIKFMTTFPVRYNAAVRKIKHLIDTHVFGKITAIMATNHGCMYEPSVPAWVMNPKENGGGCLIDHTVHVADIIRWWTNEEFDDVRAEIQQASLRSHLPAEDVAVLHGQLTNGAIYQIDASWNRRENDPFWGDVTFRIVGTKASAYVDIYNTQKIEVYDDSGITNYYPNQIIFEHGQIFRDYLMHKSQNKSMICANEVDGLRTIELVEAAYKSAKVGEKVMVTRYQV